MAGQPKTRQRTGRAPAPGASGYSWAPFAPGHELSTRHGAWSERRVSPIARELLAGLVEARPELVRYPETVMAWARAEARCVLLSEWFDERGLFDDDGKERPGLRYIAQFERLAIELRARLGLDPRSEAELTRDRADAERSVVDLDGLRAQGRKALEAREAS